MSKSWFNKDGMFIAEEHVHWLFKYAPAAIRSWATKRVIRKQFEDSKKQLSVGDLYVNGLTGEVSSWDGVEYKPVEEG